MENNKKSTNAIPEEKERMQEHQDLDDMEMKDIQDHNDIEKDNKDNKNDDSAKETVNKEAKNDEKPTEEQKEPVELTPDEIIGKFQAETEEWKNAYLRKQAEFQNFTKRKEKELNDLRNFASEKIITKLLDGVDNLGRAIDASKETKDFDGLLKGVDMILTQLKGIMESEGVKPIEAKGKYDPQFHHAVMVENNPDIEDDHIIQELQKGYTMKGKVIRPTMVKVCKKS